MWDEIYKRIAELVQQHRSTLIFVNTRRLAERVAHHLARCLVKTRSPRITAACPVSGGWRSKSKLKAGEIRALVATASLELGIDIGTVDLVCQIGSPRSIAVALQRIGRAGHWRGAIPKGRFFATTRDELIECAALVRSIRQGELDRILIPEVPSTCWRSKSSRHARREEWQEDDLFALVRRAYPYRHLPARVSTKSSKCCPNGISARRGRYGAYLHRDRRQQTPARTARQPARCDHQRRRDPRQRTVHGDCRAGRHGRRHRG